MDIKNIYKVLALLLMMATLPSITFAQITDKSKLQQFEDAITKGEEFLKAKDYPKAKAEYQRALSIDPEAKYPKDKLAQIRKVYIDPEDELRYKEAVDQGDRMYEQKNYKEAKNHYSIALTIKPDERLLREKIVNMDKLASEKEGKLIEYKQKIDQANKLFEEKQYTEARELYDQSNLLNPDDNYARSRISEIDAIVSKKKALDESYEQVLLEADDAYMNKDYNLAKIKYEQAIKLKPDENYPKSMLSRVDESHVTHEQNRQSYNSIIAKADQLFSKNDYQGAVIAYQNALQIMPDEAHPLAQITKINNMLQSEQERDDNFAKAVSLGDQLFKEGKLDESLIAFQQANNLKPQEVYPKQRIEELGTQLLATQNKIDASYREAVNKGDSLLNVKEYDKAIERYEIALNIKKDEDYPKQGIKKATELKQLNSQREAEFASLLVKADGLFESSLLEQALTEYNKALLLEPTNEYVNTRIDNINSTLLSRKGKAEQYSQLIMEADNLANNHNPAEAIAKYNEALKIQPDETYPKERIASLTELIASLEETENTFKQIVADADLFYSKNQLEESLAKYKEASKLKSEDGHVNAQIDKINSQLNSLNEIESSYADIIAKADNYYANSNYELSKAEYLKAAELKPDERHPKQRLLDIASAIESNNAKKEEYNLLITEGDGLMDNLEYAAAKTVYQKAQSLIPSEPYPGERISQIAGILEQQNYEANKGYMDALEKAGRYYSEEDYQSAIKMYELASSLKPSEDLPKDRLIHIQNLLTERMKNNMDVYNKFLAAGDLAYQSLIFDRALEEFEKAMAVRPEEQYPAMMIARIKKMMDESAMVELVTDPVYLLEGVEQRYSFKIIEMRLRKNNYILIKAKKTSEKAPKVFINYGKDGSKSGGIVMKGIESDETIDYLLRISVQDIWYRTDNNWISLYAEGGDIEITKMQISQGDIQPVQ